MKGLANLYIVFVLMLTFLYGGIILWASCEKDESDILKTQTGIPEFTCLPIHDTTGAIQSLQATRSTDGIFRMSILGNKFTNQNKNLFFQDCAWIMNDATTLYPIDSFDNTGTIQFTIKLIKGNFNCTTVGTIGNEALNCNWDKIIQAAGQADLIGVLSYGDGFGAGYNGIGVLGVGNNTSTTQIDLYYGCSLQYRITELFNHETWGHGTGCGHAFIPQYPNNIMSYATNGGCALGSTFLSFQTDTIKNYINSHIH